MGASWMLLFGVTDWWKLSNNTMSADETHATKRKALYKVTFAFSLWGSMIVFLTNSMTFAMVVGILQQAGIDVSALTQR